MTVPSTPALWITSLMAAQSLAMSGCGGSQAATSTESGALSGGAGQTQTAPTSTVGGRTAAGRTAAGGAAAGAAAAANGAAGNGNSSMVSGGTAAAGVPGSLDSGGTSSGIGGATAIGGLRNAGGTTASAGSSGRPAGGTSSLASSGGGSGGTQTTGGTVFMTGGTTSTGGTVGVGGNGVAGGNSAASGMGGGGTAPTWPKKFCGNITTQNKADPPGLTFAKHWDQITPENAGKWAAVQAGPTAAFNWAALDSIYAYAEQHGITFKENSFVWGAAQPAGVYTYANVENWIKSYCERYPKTALIDVVNEPPPHTTPTYARVLGEGERGAWPWIVKSFKLARRYCGNAVLILNDYDNLAYAPAQTHYINMVNDVRANGGPIDAIGVEAHDAYRLSASKLQESLDTLSTRTGLPIYITEYDVGLASDADQLAAFQEQFPVFWRSQAVRGVTLWGWVAGYTWIANSGLVNGTTPRPAMVWLMDYLGRPTPP